MKFFFFVLALTSCGAAPEASGPCDQRSGTYKTVLTERTGNCGSIESVETIDEQPTEPPAPCGGTIRYSDDNCEVTNIDVACPTTDGNKSVMNGKYHWNRDGSKGTGTMSLKISNILGSQLICQSTYDVTMERL